MKTEYDLIVVGSGFAGSLMSMVAKKIGLSVLLLERGKHPRFAIGESTSPLTNLLIEELSLKYDLPGILPIAQYGDWQEKLPHLACGLKRGFTYLQQNAGKTYAMRADRSNQLLVSASPNDLTADTHWFREDVDTHFVEEAVKTGVDYFDETCVTVRSLDSSGVSLSCERDGKLFETSGKFLIDATGKRGYLHRALKLKEVSFEGMPRTHSLFSHFRGVKRCDKMAEYQSAETAPYPMDDAALHHVFDGGWMWVLRFNNGITSAGISVTEEFAAEIKLHEKEGAWSRFMERFPTIGKQFSESKAIQSLYYSEGLSFRSEKAVGEGWAMLPSAAAFIDPLFSTGFPLTLLGVQRLANILESSWGKSEFALRLKEYESVTFEEADWTAKFIGGCFSSFPRFSQFASLSMFYFAAASFSEMTRRLDRRKLVTRFLAADRPEFASGMSIAVDRIASPACKETSFYEGVRDSIANMNVAGLCKPEKRNWYGADLQDVIDASHLLEYDSCNLQQILKNSLWAQE